MVFLCLFLRRAQVVSNSPKNKQKMIKSSKFRSATLKTPAVESCRTKKPNFLRLEHRVKSGIVHCHSLSNKPTGIQTFGNHLETIQNYYVSLSINLLSLSQTQHLRCCRLHQEVRAREAVHNLGSRHFEWGKVLGEKKQGRSACHVEYNYR